MPQNATQPGRKFIGRKASPCRRCGGASHWVNSLGGIVCETCERPTSPPSIRLTISGGVWIDSDSGFDAAVTPLASHAATQTAPVAAQPISAAAPTAAGQLTLDLMSQIRLVANQAAHALATRAAEEYETVRRLHAFEPDSEAWGWYEPAAMRRFVDFVAEWAAIEHKGRPFVQDAIFFSVD